jgi:uncharacterized protein with NAD-binding domain and iron-sulfur cluster
MSETSAEVVVIGSGLAGMTAALRLAQRGYKVTVFEQDEYLGGQFRAIPVKGPLFHEHCYHLFERWYHNFWNLVAELDLEDRFQGRRGIKYLRRGEFPMMTELKDVASWATYFQNLTSGVLSIPDMYLFLYSYVDLLASPLHRDRYRDVISVNEFMHTRPYATDRSTAMHENVLLKAFGVPTFESSVQSYRKFVEFGAGMPSPMFYIMKGNVHDNFWAPLEQRLVKFGVTINRNTRLNGIELGDDGRINRLRLSRVSESPTLVDAKWIKEEEFLHPVTGSVILAVPPISLSNLITPDIYKREPRWGRVLKLRNEPMASVHLHFNEKFVERLKRYNMKALPKEPVILIDSRFSITFLDNSHTWTDVKAPYLHVIASDYRELSRLDAENPDRFTYQGKILTRIAMDTADSGPDMRNPKSPLDHILAEVARYVPFGPDELDLATLEIHSNMRHPIFINEIGSWPNRPTTHTGIGNLFMAGAHCQNAIDVTTVEGAVLSGLEAAAAVLRRHGHGEPVEIRYPTTRPFYLYTPLQLTGAPYAMIAKVLSELNAMRRRAEKMYSSSLPGQNTKPERTTFVTDLISMPYELGAELLSQLFGIFRR